jgi:hypothetical protein
MLMVVPKEGGALLRAPTQPIRLVAGGEGGAGRPGPGVASATTPAGATPASWALVHVNTLMLQDVLAEAEWEDAFTPEDRRGLTPPFWIHVAPYGEVRLDWANRLPLRACS